MATFAALGTLLQLVKRQAPAAWLLHHQDSIRFDHAITAAAGDPQIVASPCALINRIQLVSNHAAYWNKCGTFVNLRLMGPNAFLLR